jgi:hypothetical protein
MRRYPRQPAAAVAQDDPSWQDTSPAPLDQPVLVSRRPQPPMREVIKGLDTRELEGQTVFDQLFGDELPWPDPRPPR